MTKYGCATLQRSLGSGWQASPVHRAAVSAAMVTACAPNGASRIEARVAELEDKVSRAEVIDVSKLSGDTVKFGAFVTLVDEDSEGESVYQIVGEFEADVKKGKISVTSPIARAIIGRRKGDSVEVMTPGGGKSYDIVRIKYK